MHVEKLYGMETMHQTNSIQLSASCEAYSLSASQEISSFLQKPKAHHNVLGSRFASAF
jgi:hypothetical protein